MDDIITYLEARGHAFTRGRHPQTCCPFHTEGEPSFTVYPDHWFCFSCRASGDYLGLRWRLEAPDETFRSWRVRFLGQPAQVVRQEIDRRCLRRQPTRVEVLVMTEAARFYLRRHTVESRAYLWRRRIDRPERLGIGFCWGGERELHELTERLRPLNPNWWLAADAVGLISQKGRERLWGRLVLPQVPAWIGGAGSQVTYYQSRRIDGEARIRYLNPPDLAPTLFGNTTFGGPVIVSEGPFDVLPLIEHEVSAIALLGTGAGAWQQLEQYEERGLILVFDPDPAGQSCAEKLRRRVRNCRVVTPPGQGKDADLGNWIVEQGVPIVAKSILGERDVPPASWFRSPMPVGA